VRELFDMMNGAREQAFQRMGQFGQSGPGPGSQPGQQAGHPEDGDYDHYNVEGSDRAMGGNRNWNQNQNRNRRGNDFDMNLGDNLAEDIGGAVFGAAMGIAGRAFGRKMKQAFEDKVVPAMQAKMAQAQGQFAQQKAEQDAIAARYPELRGCMKDQVVFLDGGTKTVPVSEIKMPVTMAQADGLVARLR
jgi:hypothetical protein